MATDLICPDCGGVIGGIEADPDGRFPCSCFKGMPPASADRSSDTVSMPAQKGFDPRDAAEKICMVCGKNVAGHRRVKDSRGYTCYECAKDEQRQAREGTIACAECGRRVKEGGIVEYGGIRICRKCFNDHKESEKKVVKKVDKKHFDAHEKKNIIILAVVFGILGLIVLWQTFKPR